MPIDEGGKKGMKKANMNPYVYIWKDGVSFLYFIQLCYV